ncbi:MAG: GAF domain-containing protein [Thermoplasmata archaeon]
MSSRRPYDAILERVRTILSHDADLETRLQLTVEALHDSMDRYTWVGIYLLEGTELVLASWKGPRETQHQRIPIGRGICGLAARTRETVNVRDVSADSRYLMCFPSTRSEIVVPTLESEKVLGEIDVDSDQLAAFNHEDEAFLKVVADELAKVLESRNR